MKVKIANAALIISLASLLSYGVILIVKEIRFNQHCEGHLKRAADANDVALAAEEIDIAIDYIEERNLTSGYTSLVYRTPDEDIEYWYRNLTSAHQSALAATAQQDSASLTQLEESNILMKLRETLIDDSESGVSVTYPFGISRYPHNWLFAIWGLMSLLVLAISGITLYRDLS